MQTGQLNGQLQNPEKRVRISVKVSESLANQLLEAYQEELEQEEEPPFKEEFMGSYFEDCVTVAAKSAVGELDAQSVAGQLEQALQRQQRKSRRLKTWLSVCLIIIVLATAWATVYYHKYKAYV